MSTVVTRFAPSGTAPTLPSVFRQPDSCRDRRLVRVVNGQFKGLIGQLLEAPSSGAWLVEVPILGNGVYLRVDADCLEPLELDAGE